MPPGRSNVLADETPRIEGLLFRRPLADVPQLADRNVLKPLTASLEVLVNLDRRFLHAVMGLFRAPAEHEIVAPRQPCMPVVTIETQAHQAGPASFRSIYVQGHFSLKMVPDLL